MFIDIIYMQKKSQQQHIPWTKRQPVHNLCQMPFVDLKAHRWNPHILCFNFFLRVCILYLFYISKTIQFLFVLNPYIHTVQIYTQTHTTVNKTKFVVCSVHVKGSHFDRVTPSIVRVHKMEMMWVERTTHFTHLNIKNENKNKNEMLKTKFPHLKQIEQIIRIIMIIIETKFNWFTEFL